MKVVNSRVRSLLCFLKFLINIFMLELNNVISGINTSQWSAFVFMSFKALKDENANTVEFFWDCVGVLKVKNLYFSTSFCCIHCTSCSLRSTRCCEIKGLMHPESYLICRRADLRVRVQQFHFCCLKETSSSSCCCYLRHASLPAS